MHCSQAVESEFEAKVEHPFPRFLLVLIQKYHRDVRCASDAWTPTCSQPPIDSIAQFATYVSEALLLHQQSPFSVDEMRAVSELLQIM